MSKTYIVDGNSLLFRAYYSTAYTGNLMMNKDGIPTNALFAFHNLMKKIKAMVSDGDHLFVAFDTEKPTKRRQEFADYKAQRAPCPQELCIQMPLARDLLVAMNITWKELEGYEADDLAGSMARYAAEKGDEVRLFSSDKDFLQLLDLGDNVTLEMPKKGLTETICYTKANLKELFGLYPNQIADFKGIAGDPSDNYKGIKGVGEKTAMKLLDEHGHLEQILEYCKANPGPKINQKFIEGEKDAIFFKELATIDTTLDMKDDYLHSDFRHYQRSVLSAFYQKYQLLQFLKGIDKLKDLDNDEEQDLFSLSNTEQQVQEVLSSNFRNRDIVEVSSFKEINEPILTLSYDTNQDNENLADLLGFAFATENKIYHIKQDDLKNDNAFRSWLSDETKKISVYDYKGMLVLLNRFGYPEIKGVRFDLLIATYLINPDSGQRKEDLFLAYGVSLDKEKNIACQIAGYTTDLKEQVEKDIDSNEERKLFDEIELPLSKVLAGMEIEGFPIDKDTLSKINVEYNQILSSLEQQIYNAAGEKFNINSPKQLEHVLFEVLEIKKYKGEKGTGIEVLRSHIHDHPVVPLIIEYRLYNKLVSGYTTALPEHIFKDNKIHAIYNQALTSTGRLSMSEPNLQNISIRNEEGKNIRKAFFYPDHEFYMLSLDYSQIELRVLAHVGNIKALKEIFELGEDIHRATAAKVFGVPFEEVTSEMRRRAKAVNFGIVYGISPYGLSQQLEIPVAEAGELIKQFKNAFEGIDEFQNSCIAKAREQGYVTTMLNRRRYLKDINSEHRAMRSFSERAAVNSVIQGTAADLIKIAMVKTAKLLENYKTKIILQIHDELIFKVPKEELETILPLVKKAMEEALTLTVPLKVDGTYALDWYEAH